MTLRTTILTSTAVAGLLLSSISGVSAEETSLMDKARGAIMPSASTEMVETQQNLPHFIPVPGVDSPEIIAMGEGTSIDSMIPPALIEPAAGGMTNDTMTGDTMMDETMPAQQGKSFWEDVPGATVPATQSKEVAPVVMDEDQSSVVPRSGFEDPFDPSDLNNIETAAGDAMNTMSTTTGTAVNSVMGFEDPAPTTNSVIERVVPTGTNDGSDLADIMPAAGEEEVDAAVEAVEDAVDTQMREAGDHTDNLDQADTPTLTTEDVTDAVDSAVESTSDAIDSVVEGAKDMIEGEKSDTLVPGAIDPAALEGLE